MMLAERMSCPCGSLSSANPRLPHRQYTRPVSVRESDEEVLQRSRRKKSSACLKMRVIPFTRTSLRRTSLTFERSEGGEEFKFSYLCRTDSKVISYGNCQRLCEEWHKIVRCLSKVCVTIFSPFFEVVVSKFGHFF